MSSNTHASMIDALCEFDASLRAGESPDIASRIKAWPIKEEREELTIDLFCAGWEYYGRDYGWLAMEMSNPSLKLDRMVQAVILRKTFDSLAEEGLRTSWRDYQRFGFLPSELNLSAEGDRLHLGQVVGGNYTIVERIARGGCGTIYEGVDNYTLMRVIIKSPADGPHSDDFESRLLEEAQVLARLALPGTPRLIGCLPTDCGLLVCMEYVKGRTLREVLLDESVDRARRLQLVARAARVLDAVHQRGYIHGDVRADNFIVGDNDEVTVIDFGMSRRDLPTGAQPGVRGGTPAVMAPETLVPWSEHGQPSEDIYALGCLLFLALTNEWLLPATDIQSVAERYSALDATIDQTNSLNAAERTICQSAVTLDPFDRFERALDLAEACEFVAAGVKGTTQIPRRRTGVLAVRTGQLMGGIEAKVAIMGYALTDRHDWIPTAFRDLRSVPNEVRAVSRAGMALGLDLPAWTGAERLETLLHGSPDNSDNMLRLASECDDVEKWLAAASGPLMRMFDESGTVVSHAVSRALRMARYAPVFLKAWMQNPRLSPLPEPYIGVLHHVWESTNDEAIVRRTLHKIERLIERIEVYDLEIEDWAGWIRVSE